MYKLVKNQTMLSGSLWSLALKQHTMLGLFISHWWDRLCTLIYARMKSYKNEIVQKRASASIVFTGDFNARTGEMVDFATDRWSDTHQHLTEKRLNGDKKVNTYGKKLIELTRSNNIVLLNGRMRSYSRSRNSQFTCYKYNGASAVNYVIADYDILNAVK